MIIRILELKTQMIKNGISMIDLSDVNFKINYLSPLIQVTKIFLAEERHLCRPDLLSFDSYGNADHIDMILKFNQITNPFSIDINDPIVVPSLSSASAFYAKSENSINNNILDTKALYIDPSRASKKDIARIKQLEQLASKRKNGSKEIKPTNLLRAGEKPFIADGQALRFAPDSSK